MDWIAGSLIIVGVSSALIVAATRRRAPATVPPEARDVPPAPRPAPDDTLARRVRRLEDELDDLGSQMAQLRDDVQYLQRQIEDRD